MKTFVLVTLIAGLTTSALYGQAAPTDRAAVEKQIVASEQKINDAFGKRDVAGMKANVADDAVAIDPGGVTSVNEFFKQLPTMDVKLTDVKLSDFKYHWVDTNNVVLTYTWTGKGTVSGQPVQSPGGLVRTTLASTLGANGLLGSDWGSSSVGLPSTAPGRYLLRNAWMPLVTAEAVYSPLTGRRSLPCSATSEPARRRIALRFCSM